MLHRVRDFIRGHHLIRPGDALVAGVSGGADSVALLAVLRRLRADLGIRALGVVHVNHQLRRGADADQRFVERLCAAWQIPCFSARVTVRSGRGVEEEARDRRYEIFFKTADRVKADALVLAHHQDDLAETVLMHLIRGSGLLGLQGIQPRRVLQGRVIIRPFLGVNRAAIETFLTREGIAWRRDPSNRDVQFLRNRIRHQLLPLLVNDYNPRARERLAQLAETAGTDYDFINQEADRAFDRMAVMTRRRVALSLPKLRRLHPALLRMVLRRAVREAQGDLNRVTAAHMREIEGQLASGAEAPVVSLPGDVRVYRWGQQLHVCARKA